MPIDESVGTVAVDVVGDYSQLEKDLDNAQDIGAAAGEKIGAAFNAASAGIDSTTSSMDAFDQSVQSAVDGGMSLAEAMAAAGAPLGDVAAGADAAAEGSKNLGDAVHEAGEQAHGARDKFDEFGGEVEKLAEEFGLIIGAKELITETFEAFSRVESATVALTGLTGSAELAEEQLRNLESLATSENLSFPALLTADQNMVAFGFALDQIPGALQAVADAAAVSNRAVDEVGNSFDRIAASGMLTSRTLVQLRLTTADVADAMGVTEPEVQKLFKAMDQSGRIDVLTAALGKFAGQSQVAAETLKGQWQGVKNAFESFFVSLGDLLEPAAKAMLTFFTSIANAAKLWVDVITIAFQKIEAGFVRLTQGADAYAKLVAKFAAEENAKAGPEKPPGSPAATDDIEARAKRIQDAVAAAKNSQLVTLDPDKLKPIKDYTSDLEIAIEMEQQQEAAIKKTSEAIAAYGVKLKNAGVDISGINLAQAYFDDQMIQGALAIGKIGDEIPPVTDSYGRLARNSEEVAKNQAAVNKESAELGKTLDSMLGKIKPPADAVAESFAKIDSALAKGDWRMVEQDVNRLATTSLPAAIDAQEKYIGALDRTGAAAGKLNDAQTVLYHMQIKLAEETGADATAAVIGLKNTQIETQILIDKSTGLGQVYVGLMDTFSNTFTDLGRGFSDVITQTKSLGDAMVGVFKKVESEIVNTVVGYAFKLLKNAILENTGLMKQLTGLFGGIAGGGAGAVGSHVGSAAPSIPGLGQGGGSSSGGGLLGGGGLFGGINMVTGVVSAVSGVISAISGLHTNTLLARIEESTRYLKIGLVTQGDSLLNMTHQIRDIQLWGFPAINDALQSILYNGVGQAAMAGGGGNVIVNFNGPISGVSQDTVESLADQLFRLFKLKNG